MVNIGHQPHSVVALTLVAHFYCLERSRRSESETHFFIYEVEKFL